MRRGAAPQNNPGEVERWIEEARGGSREALNRLLEVCRAYLLLVANQDLDPAVRARLGPSDVVQESLVEAARGFPDFRGSTEAELLAWLRRILQHNLANVREKHIEAGRRSVAREVPLAETPLGDLQFRLLAPDSSPSQQMRASEEDEAVQRALAQLPEHYRQVLVMHTWDGMTFAQIGAQTGRSEDAARKLWGRAAEELAQLLGESP